MSLANIERTKIVSMPPRIWLSQPHLGMAEADALTQLFVSSGMAAAYRNVFDFEQKLSERLGGHVVALSSCTAAIHLALKTLGVTQGDTVICATFTFVATANPILYLGAEPVFVDSEALTWNMCPEALETALKREIATGKRPKAVIVVHTYGMPAQIELILDICQRYGVPLIEDAAGALGASYAGRALGTWGDIGVYSFNTNKVITTGGGGALITNNARWAEKVTFWATQAKDTAAYYQHSEMGYNYRMGPLAAAIGIAQLSVLDERVTQRRSHFHYYQNNLKKHSFHWQAERLPQQYASHWLSSCLLPTDKNTTNIELMQFLSEYGVESRLLWKTLHKQPLFQNYRYYGGKVAEILFERGISFPSGNDIQTSDLEFVTKVIARFFCDKK